ncbi:OLC1v1009139C1 [Oldenlandia corymbosa var. corymbosa]|uniref:OLC1v1009139C1 n=1 Tax=Oldenlandia corymbosa var. corymbosa TaxID=529605 RepID=A0AAV1DN95_OLDCO|nr:OLC1v1009139C1 [Oldenlandia corymbosa var. corymbosa]
MRVAEVKRHCSHLVTDNIYESKLKKEACWTISNITAGNKEQIQEAKKEAAWALSNPISGGTLEQIKFLESQGCIMTKPLCDLLVCSDPNLIRACLTALENILEVGEVEKNLGDTGSVNVFAKMIDEANGKEKIENLPICNDNDNKISFS